MDGRRSAFVDQTQEYIDREGAALRCGYTTGSCAAAAAKAACMMLLGGGAIPVVELTTPKGVRLLLEVEEICKGADWASCGVRKDGGDDPDATNGLLIVAIARQTEQGGVVIKGGEGVGRVTRGGLDQPIGAAAINSVPRNMIVHEAKEALAMHGNPFGVEITICAPKGEEAARQTFNPRLGIVGGISILGTTGIVTPMSRKALVESIRIQMRQLLAEGHEYLVLTPGNYGQRFCLEQYQIPGERLVLISNFVGEALDLAVREGAKGVLLIGHIGKLVKVAGGIMNTHSREGDARMELLAVHGLLCGASASTARAVAGCAVTGEALALLDREGLAKKTCGRIGEKMLGFMDRRAGGRLKLGVVLYEESHGLLAESGDASSLLRACGSRAEGGGLWEKSAGWESFGPEEAKAPDGGLDAPERRNDQGQREACRQTVAIVGAGPGVWEGLTIQGAQAIDQAQVYLGSRRMLELVKGRGKPLHEAYRPREVREWLENHREFGCAAVLMSGDIGFYSGAEKLFEELRGDFHVRLLPGLSTVSCFCAKLGIAWDDMCLASVHGRRQNLVGRIRTNGKVFALLSGEESVYGVCGELEDLGMSHVEVCVRQSLCYENERIWRGSPGQALSRHFDGLCCAVFLNPRREPEAVSPGIEDDLFIRGKVPMTKEEVRAVSIAKLRLTKDAVVYDVGAGTGAVSVEMARAASEGAVYAVEKNREAAALVRQNRKKFGLSNLMVVEGTAPEALQGLPRPTHAFIGGSGGNLQEIISFLMERNPMARVVVSAISLETAGELAQLAASYEVETVLVQVSRTKSAGAYHLMTGQNPVLVAVVTGKAGAKPL